ncbi:hypothetical protein ZIOFF_014724 [Zingiber officinale]|uniref:R13L1/DRL21-like LRR repeat region domain-containing protein n=1 Tax=Zingiber officinale TaxID=94328 RepID=A0A8J5HQE4_ZINOF|nr:hypothetical protein ZIOFF_014724 [Zingiber officinale]
MFRQRDMSQWQELANELSIRHYPSASRHFSLMQLHYWPFERIWSFLYELMFGGSSVPGNDEDVLQILVAEGTLTYYWHKRNIEFMPLEYGVNLCFFRMKEDIEVTRVARKLRTLVLHREEKNEHICQIETEILENIGGCCRLSELPDDLSGTKNLMQLNMAVCTALTRMPSGIRQWINLQSLRGIDAVDGQGNIMLSELQDLRNLESLHIQHLERLELDELKSATLPTYLLKDQDLYELVLHWERWNDMATKGTSNPMVQLLEGFLRSLRELKVLQIISYMSKRLPTWLMLEPRLIVLKKLKRVELVNLRRLEMWLGMKSKNRLEKGLGLKSMPRLEKWLGMKSIRRHVEIVVEQRDANAYFQIQFLVEPGGINMLQIFGCQELRNLPNDIRNIHNL